jgi:hypothetical protein
MLEQYVILKLVPQVGAKMRSLRSPRSAKVSTVEGGLLNSAAIRAFLERELPPAKSPEASYLAEALVAAGARYDRYAENKQNWLKFAPRRRRLENTAKLAIELASTLYDLDILSRDDLASRFGLKEIEALLGSLLLLKKEAADLAKQVQKSGRPRDLAEERWILELADIYEIAFAAKPRIWGSGSETTKRRGKFYDLLMVSRPLSFPQHGKLSPRQVHRTLEQRRTRQRKSFAV